MELVLEFLKQHLCGERSVGLLGISYPLFLFTQKQMASCHIVRPCRWYFRCIPLLTSTFLWSGSGCGIGRTCSLCMQCSLFEEKTDTSHSGYKCLLPSNCLYWAATLVPESLSPGCALLNWVISIWSGSTFKGCEVVTFEACGWDNRLEMISHIHLVMDMERIERLEDGIDKCHFGIHTRATSAKVCINDVGNPGSNS